MKMYSSVLISGCWSDSPRNQSLVRFYEDIFYSSEQPLHIRRVNVIHSASLSSGYQL
jgi:hypothetical protein